MALPWEKYASPVPTPTPESVASGPWSNYASPTPSPVPTPTPTPVGPERVSTGDWRTQAYETTRPDGSKSRITSPSDLATFMDPSNWGHAFGLSLRNTGEALASLPSFLMEGAAAASDRPEGFDAGWSPEERQAFADKYGGGAMPAFAKDADIQAFKTELETQRANKSQLASLITGEAAPQEPPPEPSFNFGRDISDAVGLPVAENNAERIISAVQQGATAAVTPLGAGKLLEIGGTSPKLAQFLTALPKTQVASGATAGLSGELAHEAGATPGQTLAATLVGGFAPFARPSLLLRGPVQAAAGGSDSMNNRISDFVAAGDHPSIGQATQSPLFQWIESALSYAPVANLVMRGRALKQQANIGNNLADRASALAPEASKMEVGSDIIDGLNAARGSQTAQQRDLYQQFFDLLPQGRNTRIDLPDYRKMLEELTALEPGAPATSAGNIHPAIAKLKEDFYKDAGIAAPGDVGLPLPYEAIRAAKTRLSQGAAFNDPQRDIYDAAILRLTGAMSNDLKAAASNASPEARTALDAANDFTSSIHKDRQILSQAIKQAGFQDEAAVHNAVTTGMKDGSRKLDALMRQLNPDQQRLFITNLMRDAFTAKPGQRVSELAAGSKGETTSVASGLTWLNSLPKETKNVLKNTPSLGPEWAKAIDSLERVASNITSGSRAFSNPSGTAQVVGTNAVAGYILNQLGHADFHSAMLAAGGVGGSALLARLMTNKNFVLALARNANEPLTALPQALNQMAVIADRKKDPEMATAVEALKKQVANPPQSDTTL